MSSRDIVKKRWKNSKWQIISVVISIALSIFLVKMDYVVQNHSFPLFDDVTRISVVDYILGDKIENKKTFFNEDSVTYVNFAKDKVLVPVTDMFGDTLGTAAITNRETILRFLELADSSDYKYIFLDVRFEKGYDTPFDSALFAKIKAMPRLVIATHRNNGDYEITDSDLLAKAAYADYRGSIFSGFTRYEFLQDGCRSVALQMLYDIDKQDIKKHKCKYKSEGKSCYNLQYIPLPHYLFKGKDNNDSITFEEEVRYPYAGSMILNPKYVSRQEIIQNLLNDKIIIAGDFDNDLHSTFVGEIPGPVLSLAAYQYLHAGLHKVRYFYIIILFVLYFLVSYLILLSGGHISNFVEDRPVLHIFLSLLSLSLLFLFVKILLYGCFLISMVTFVPFLVFWLMCVISFSLYERQKEKQRAIELQRRLLEEQSKKALELSLKRINKTVRKNKNTENGQTESL